MIASDGWHRSSPISADLGGKYTERKVFKRTNRFSEPPESSGISSFLDHPLWARFVALMRLHVEACIVYTSHANTRGIQRSGCSPLPISSRLRSETQLQCLHRSQSYFKRGDGSPGPRTSSCN